MGTSVQKRPSRAVPGDVVTPRRSLERRSMDPASSTFCRTIRSLAADRLRHIPLAVLGVAVLLGSWLAWFTLAQVTVYEATDAGRLEVSATVHPLAATVGGRLVASRLSLGREVRAGEVLVELDGAVQRLQRQEERARANALSNQLSALAEEMAAERRRFAEARAVLRATRDEARQQVEQAEARVALAQDQAERTSALFTRELVAQMDIVRARAEARERGAALQASRHAMERFQAEERLQENTHHATTAELERRRASLKGQAAAASAVLARLEEEIDRRRIRAPVDGRVAEAAPLPPGTVVSEGEKLGSILPRGDLRAIAEFSPDSLGRLARGQPARLRLPGFAAPQYGTIPATVTNVADELRNGRVRVELAVHSRAVSRIPVRHALPANVAVEVEKVSPATLVLRAAGRVLGSVAPRSN
jgi:multidrug resistance efflux pump